MLHLSCAATSRQFNETWSKAIIRIAGLRFGDDEKLVDRPMKRQLPLEQQNQVEAIGTVLPLRGRASEPWSVGDQRRQTTVARPANS
jgi:hypothetical protein